jgi:hypothetical protein
VSINDRELEATRKALNASLKQAKVLRGLSYAQAHFDKTQLYQAVAHALCFRAQFAGVSQAELSDLIHDRKAQASASISMSAKALSKLEARLGLVRSTEHERKAINRVLSILYKATDDVPTEIVLALFAKFCKTHAPQIGLPVDVALTRIENLDALTRFAGSPKRYIPEDQYGL